MDSPDTPAPTANTVADKPFVFRFKATTYVWFVLLCAGALWSRVPAAPRTGASLSARASDASGTNGKSGDGARLDSGSAQSFSDSVQAEHLTRAALAGETLSRSLMGAAREAGKPAGAPKPSRPDDPRQSSHLLYTQAIKETRTLATRTGSVNMARRVIILEHAAGRPLDVGYLQGTLSANLKNRGKNAADIAWEVGFWTQLYGAAEASARPSDKTNLVADADRLLSDKDTELGLLAKKVRADALEVTGSTGQAGRLDREVTTTATRSLVWTVVSTGLLFLAGVCGLVILVILLILSLVREFRLSTFINPTLPSPALFTLLVDSFVFYYALLFVSRPVLGLLARQVAPGGPGAASPDQALYFTMGSYVLINGLAALYAGLQLRRGGFSLADIGVSGRQLLASLGWGVVGYCTVLPLVYALGWLAGLIFRNNPNVAPNPALPLLASTEGLVPRLIIFLMVAVCAPLFEEFFFRGVLYTGLRARWGAVASILISATLFAIGHPLQDWLPILGLGIAFAALREWRQSVVPGMVAHFLQNGMTFLTLSLLFSK